MSFIGNLIWIIFGGFFVFLYYLFGSIILILTIVGIPFGIQTLKLAGLALFPFGKEVQQGKRATGCLYIIMNIIWIVVAGVELALIHLLFAFLFAITIIGIPLAVQHVKLAGLALIPFGYDVVRR
jgi:uncharacterized membrane protein YccF (DUF307 family)